MATTPTLRMILTEDAEQQTAAAGIDLDTAFEQLVGIFAQADLSKNPTFEAAAIEDIETRKRFTDFESTIIGRFRGADGILTLILATGDVVELRLVRG